MYKLNNAIREWKVVLTSKRVLVDDDVLRNEGTATFKTTQKIHAILKPSSVNEVSKIMKIANRNNIPVYPISAGKNWGLGSKVPQRDGVLIDLSHMSKIKAFNETMGYMTVEPGVTFQIAVDFLEKKKSGLMLDTIGSTPHASIVGNTAERGHGMGLYADRFNFVCGFEVVLPDGKIIKTGFENFEKSKLGPLAKWGVGPYVDGLFTQSNLGIITSLTIWLKRKPAFFQSFIFHVDDEMKLSALLDEWRQMGLEGFNASLRIFNDMRMISFAERFPENEKPPLSNSKRLELRAKYNIGKWIGIGGVYPPSPRHAEADRDFIKSRITKYVDSLDFYDEASVNEKYNNATQTSRDYLDFIFNKSLLRGNTSKSGLNMVYWRKPESVRTNDLHHDRCGVLWYCPAIPATGKDARKAIKICEQACKKYGFELNLGFLFITQRTLDITGAICYDRDVKGEDECAMKCHDEIMRTMTSHGYSPYRLGIQSMSMTKLKDKTMRELLFSIKSLLDPNHILAPGHYTL